MKAIKNEIEAVLSYTANNRFDNETKLKLLQYATDAPETINIPKASYSKLKMKHYKKDIVHQPILSAFILRIVGAHTKALSNFSVRSFDSKITNFKNFKKENEVRKLALEILNAQDPKLEEQLYKELEIEVNKEISTEPEKFATSLLNQIILYLDNKNEYAKMRFLLESLGEAFTTVDVLENSISPRICLPWNVYYLPGEDQFNIGTAPKVVENLYWPILSLFDKFNLKRTHAAKLKKLLKGKSTEGGGDYTSATYSFNQALPKGGDQVDIILENFKSGELHGLGNDFDHDSENELIKVQKYTKKFLRPRYKLFRTTVNIQEDNYQIVSTQYKAKPGEKLVPFDQTIWKVYYYVPKIDAIIFEKELHTPHRNSEQNVHINSYYAGYVMTVNYITPYSFVNTLLSLVDLRSLLYSNISQLISDNLGYIISLQYKAIPKKLSYAEWLSSLVYTKVVQVDSTQRLSSGAISGVLGDYVKQPIDIMSLDTSGNIRNLFEQLRYIEEAILTAKGTTREAQGDIGQNSRVSNVRTSLAQTNNVQAPTNKIAFLTLSGFYQYCIDIMQIINKDRDTNVQSLLNDKSMDTSTIAKNTFSNELLRVYTNTSIEELLALEEAKDSASAAVHQGRLDYTTYTKIIRSKSIAEVTELMEVAQQKTAKSQQEQLKAQQEAEAKSKQDEHNRELEKLKAKGEIDRHLKIIENQGDLAVAKLKVAATKSPESNL